MGNLGIRRRRQQSLSAPKGLPRTKERFQLPVLKVGRSTPFYPLPSSRPVTTTREHSLALFRS